MVGGIVKWSLHLWKSLQLEVEDHTSVELTLNLENEYLSPLHSKCSLNDDMYQDILQPEAKHDSGFHPTVPTMTTSEDQ